MDVYAVGATVNIFFTTNSAAGAAVAPSSAFEATDVKLYKNGSSTERSSTSGWTMTSPFDSIVGLHLLSIDLSDNADAGFYAAGNYYTAVLSPDTETVDSQSVAAVIGAFQIGPIDANVTRWLSAVPNGLFSGLVEAKMVNYGANITDSFSDTFWDEALAGHQTASTAGWYMTGTAKPGDAMDLIADAVDAAAFATSAISELVAGILAGTVTAPTAAPTAPYTVDDVLGWLLAIAKFQRTQTATTETVYRDDGTTAAATAAKTDNGTTFTRGEFS